jgi:amidohydrolase
MTTLTPANVQTVLEDAIALRHDLHQHPEIRFEEVWTSDRIARFLAEAGVPHERGYAKGTGIVAVLEPEGGAAPDAPTVALRADMDALEIQEQTGLPYASKIPNRMHACGHDGHSATLCGTAKLLAGMRDRLKGRVKFIFQPAEEIAAGGRYIVQEGVLDGVDAAFAFHGWPTVPLGRVSVRPGWMMAGAQDFFIRVNGRGCHGADPAAGVDPIVAAAQIVVSLQTVVSREINPWDAGVVTVGRIEAGQSTNIIPEMAVVQGTMRSIKPDVMERISSSVERIAVNTARALGAEAEVRFADAPYPPLYNDPEMTEFVREVAQDVLGEQNVEEPEAPCMGAEDFAFYLQKAPGALIYLGVNPNPDEPYPSLHNPRYNFGDGPLEPGIKVMANLALRFLERESLKRG